VDVKFTPKQPPRRFAVGNTVKFEMQDCGTMHLQPDEQLTFVTEQGAEYDLARKDWGFYATPSLNSRLLNFGLRGVLVKNNLGRYFLMLVERGKDNLFEEYLKVESLDIICWMDTTESLDRLAAAVKDKP
jgi:hypothetical protein